MLNLRLLWSYLVRLIKLYNCMQTTPNSVKKNTKDDASFVSQ